MQEYTTIYDRAEDSFIERKSEFIGHIAPVETEEQALAFIAEIKKKHHDATHNTHAYILRNGVKRYSRRPSSRFLVARQKFRWKAYCVYRSIPLLLK